MPTEQETAPPAPAPGAPRTRINDLAIRIATANGTGSASANRLLMQSIFRMGIPVTGKNVFPSNIQGLPTWYEIRANGDGWTARSPDYDLVVAMNPATYRQDIAGIRSGGWVLYDDSRPLAPELRRDDVTFLGIPLARMGAEQFRGSRTLILMKNMGYVGAVAALLDIGREVVRAVLEEGLGAKKKELLEANYQAFDLGWDYAREHFDCPLPTRLRAMDANRDAILIDGNTAAALGCLYAGATVASWYPITPSTSLVQAFERYARRYRRDPDTGSLRAAVIQAEDELAAAGMAVGASWMGARAFSATSGPGISLMSEFIGLAYYTEIPLVLFDVQRTGPSTGMPTRTQQGDLLPIAYASHGDTRHIALFPADPAECFELAVAAFDLADRFQTPVFVVSDLDIGMNDWVVPRLEWDESYRPDRGKVLGAEELEGGAAFRRYADVDGDGVPWRTLPGTHPRGAFFTRGSGHDSDGRYTEDAGPYTEVVDRLDRKHRAAAGHLPGPVVGRTAGARLALVCVGGCNAACREARHLLAQEGIEIDYLRVRAFPFSEEVEAFLLEHDTVFVVEQNRDAQLRHLLVAETRVPKDRLVSIRHYGGVPLGAAQVTDDVRAHLGRLGAESRQRRTGGALSGTQAASAPREEGGRRP
ncbi:MAG TPA: 2-oxoacid:acceptor oxidoreductase subunit alpha [Gammaproteobacteria bacterium]|nr:2-oxoacid:acceptor oxidoreductase subunit alpha [Gammaproteobacteria bacterium]